MSRLDNFAIQIKNSPQDLAYISIIKERDVCPGEAQARAVRAKKYLVEHCGVPANRVIWRECGSGEHFLTLLLLKPPNYELYDVCADARIPRSEIRVLKNCDSTVAAIKRSKW
jgi:hypothetical protein